MHLAFRIIEMKLRRLLSLTFALSSPRPFIAISLPPAIFAPRRKREKARKGGCDVPVVVVVVAMRFVSYYKSSGNGAAAVGR